MGALAPVTAGLVARTLVPPPEIPVGAPASLVGGPCLPPAPRPEAETVTQIVAVSITKR